ncbi:MAG: virulence factor SrfC family protein, partial [Desulfovibrionaceae bacterium]|nr:virulence factor SrfC family protein [Desulfovibrionaceae bacterium]
MREKDTKLAQQCLKWGDTALTCEQWLTDNRELAGSEYSSLCKNMRSASRTFRKLATAASRKMCIAVFGPSQAGKSYLISALARDSRGELIADFAGRPVDFITKINPEGGKESTGLVTRFTTTPPAGVTADKPVRLRLFSEMDLVRVFANTYYNDCQHEDAPNQQALLEALKELGKNKKKYPANPLTRDDIEDLREYMQKFRSNARVQMLNNTYWKQAADLAPYLELEERAALFGLIWDSVDEFTMHFTSLARALEKLGNAPEVNCTLDALLPREKSIIDVALLSPQAPGADEEVELESEGGRSVPLTRCQVTALTAELTIYMPERPAPFFEHTDLLDFPGYRSRLKTLNLEETLRTPGQLENFFLRGKVAYLFERYCEECELTGMLLCIGPGNQEVQDLPSAIDNWITLTQGATPAERAKHEAMLFFLLTKMDLEFEDKKGVTDAGDRWETRMKASLTEFFGRAHSWPADWDGRPFRNVFLIRNPNVVCNIFSHSSDGKETGISSEKVELVGKVKTAFLKSDLVRLHFEDRQESWDAAMKLNDGGIGLLRRKLAPICDPDRKYNQTLDRANEKAHELESALARFYRSDDTERRVAEKTQLAKGLIQILAKLVQAQRFADFLSRFQVSDHDLYGKAMACDDSVEEGGVEIDTQPITGTATSADDLLGELFGDGMGDLFGAPAAPAAKPASAAPQAQAPAAEPSRGRDQIEIFCNDAVEHWISLVREQVANPDLQRVYKLPLPFLEKFAAELVQAASRARLLEDMIQAIRAKSGFRNITREVAAWRMAGEAAYRINSFVSWL